MENIQEVSCKRTEDGSIKVTKPPICLFRLLTGEVIFERHNSAFLQDEFERKDLFVTTAQKHLVLIKHTCRCVLDLRRAKERRSGEEIFVITAMKRGKKDGSVVII